MNTQILSNTLIWLCFVCAFLIIMVKVEAARVTPITNTLSLEAIALLPE